MTYSTDFLVSRKNLNETKFLETTLTLGAGQALIKVDRFALTANNITYGAFGDRMMYWNFFPAPEGWGRIPVWGFGNVEESNAEGIKPGQRLYGYFPMSSHVIVEPVRVTPEGFFDGVAHRQKMAPVYNRYQDASNFPAYDQTREAQHALLRPLFTTSFLIDDLLADNDFFGAREVILSSASSKTSLGLAFLLHSNRRSQVAVVGLTSKSNKSFVEKTRYYERVVAYEDIAQSRSDKPAAFIDMAGNGEIRTAVHNHWTDRLKYSSAVGATHWDKAAQIPELPGPKPQMFFAPDRVKKRNQDWGPGGLDKHLSEAWVSFNASVDDWMKISEGRGRTDLEQRYREMVSGRTSPEAGIVLSL